jgi:hypothetical protein
MNKEQLKTTIIQGLLKKGIHPDKIANNSMFQLLLSELIQGQITYTQFIDTSEKLLIFNKNYGTE